MAPVGVIKASPLHIIGNSTNITIITVITNIITTTINNIISRHSQVAAIRDSGGLEGRGRGEAFQRFGVY